MTAPVLEHYPRYGTFVWMDERLVRVDTTAMEVRETMRNKVVLSIDGIETECTEVAYD
jgi:hypothetical protein